MTATRPFLLPAFLVSLYLVSFLPASAQTFSVIHDVNCTTDGCDDQQPVPLAQGWDGNLYGQMYSGGKNSYGTAWKVTPSGTFTAIASFAYPSSNNAVGGLALALDGNYYGVSVHGGANGVGYVFKVTPTGVLTILYSFTSSLDGGFDGEPLTIGPDGNLYGFDWYNCYFFKITVSTGKFSNVSHTCPQGGFFALTLGADGNFYGVADNNGTFGKGFVYRVNTAGKISVLHNFDGTDGESPIGNLVQATDGDFYGVTSQTPTNAFAGEIYKVTPSGKVTVLHTFASNGSEGANIVSGLVAASDGNLYGTSNTGGTHNSGVLYKLTRTGTFTVVHNFDCATDGCNNWVPLVQRTDGTLFGISQGGGTYNTGTVYRLASSSLPSFLTVQNYSAKSGATVNILGNGFTGATAVKFGSIAATSFKVVNSTLITAVVPPTAITSLVSVTTPTGTVSAQKNLKVAPTVTGFDPPSGPVGTQVVIKGTSFTGATKVTFGGVAATQFTVNSVTEITATVPSGALTGKIVVVTPAGTGSTATSFTVN